VTLSWENKTKKIPTKLGTDGGQAPRRRDRAWWREGEGGRRPGRGPGDAGSHRVSHFCGDAARARAAQAAARARAACADDALGGRHCVCPCSLHCQLRTQHAVCRGKSPKIALLAHFNFAQCCVGGRWRARGVHEAKRGADLLCSCPCSNFGAEHGGARFTILSQLSYT
jgi:hypothetical protein